MDFTITSVIPRPRYQIRGGECYRLLWPVYDLRYLSVVVIHKKKVIFVYGFNICENLNGRQLKYSLLIDHETIYFAF